LDAHLWHFDIVSAIVQDLLTSCYIFPMGVILSRSLVCCLFNVSRISLSLIYKIFFNHCRDRNHFYKATSWCFCMCNWKAFDVLSLFSVLSVLMDDWSSCATLRAASCQSSLCEDWQDVCYAMLIMFCYRHIWNSTLGVCLLLQHLYVHFWSAR